VQGRIVQTTLAYWAPDINTLTTVLLPGGSSWWVTDAQNGFYQLWITCEANLVWVPAALVEPNYDAVWQGALLPPAGN